MEYMVKIFDYIPELDCFTETKEYREIAERIGLGEWTWVNWIGRLFAMDNDYGEHWFDNWDEREAISDKAEGLGYESDFLLIISPNAFKDGKDGPCHSDSIRKMFWTDVLKSLTLSLDTLFAEASDNNSPVGDSEHLPLRKRFKEIRLKYQQEAEHRYRHAFPSEAVA